MIFLAICFWQPIASIVTMQPFNSNTFNNSGIAVISLDLSLVFICPKDSTRKSIIGNIMEMKARGASIIAIIEKGDEEIKNLVNDYIEIDTNLPEVLSPIPFVVPLQLFAYYMALERDCDPDMPRNLAKSVTVK